MLRQFDSQFRLTESGLSNRRNHDGAYALPVQPFLPSAPWPATLPAREAQVGFTAASAQSPDLSHRGGHVLNEWERQNKDVMGHFMSLFISWLESRLLQLSSPGERRSQKPTTDGEGQASSKRRPENSTDGSRDDGNRSRQGISKRIRLTRRGSSHRGGPNDEGEDDSDTKGPRATSQARSKGKMKNEPLLACPFYQHNPLKYRHHEHCSGPGWPMTKRVK